MEDLPRQRVFYIITKWETHGIRKIRARRIGDSGAFRGVDSNGNIHKIIPGKDLKKRAFLTFNEARNKVYKKAESLLGALEKRMDRIEDRLDEIEVQNDVDEEIFGLGEDE